MKQRHCFKNLPCMQWTVGNADDLSTWYSWDWQLALKNYRSTTSHRLVLSRMLAHVRKRQEYTLILGKGVQTIRLAPWEV